MMTTRFWDTMFKAELPTLLIALLLPVAACAAEPITLTEEQVAGHTVYRLENYRVSLLIAPARGGAVTSYRDKLGDNVELIVQRPNNGLCMDHFQSQSWPGELLVGQYSGQPHPDFQVTGRIAGVKIYHRPLEPAEVAEMCKSQPE